ncbi:hypothetical protein PISMIDRAFT_452624 [Pisolithus microcarpus 441]|uniref:Uncharacterized protein n=1 Tax=Pisolithus microcarpus 441 TaxID=765257 RepID=A0A0C9YPU2_9AGAM|nr:hypothetical protein PISMIDRAFT_452624 [Pisolithus microcarpus 441]
MPAGSVEKPNDAPVSPLCNYLLRILHFYVGTGTCVGRLCALTPVRCYYHTNDILAYMAVPEGTSSIHPHAIWIDGRALNLCSSRIRKTERRTNTLQCVLRLSFSSGRTCPDSCGSRAWFICAISGQTLYLSA